MRLTGRESLRRKLRDLHRELAESALPKLLNDGAEAFADEIRSQAPVDTGQLRATVEVAPAVSRGGSIHASVEVGDDSGRVGPVEFGKVGQEPNPFIRRSFAAKLRQIKARIASGVAKAVRNAR